MCRIARNPEPGWLWNLIAGLIEAPTQIEYFSKPTKVWTKIDVFRIECTGRNIAGTASA